VQSRGHEVRRFTSAAILALIATVSSPIPARPQAEDGVPIPRKSRIEPGLQVIELPDLENVQRRRADEMRRDAEAANDLGRREVHYRQERMGPINFRLWN